MNYRMIRRFVSKILLIEAVFMVPPLAISLYCGETEAVWAFLASIGIMLAAGGIGLATSKGTKKAFRAREGMVCVGLCWIFLSAFGALPPFLSGAIPNYVDALFEMVSGFTTTGASVVPDVESLPMGILCWRSFSHWLGGMGVLVFLLAISRGREREKGYTMHLLRAESPGPEVGKLVPKMKQSAEILYLIYILLTVLNVIFLVAGDMPLFEALCTAYGTAGTGGFGIKNDSMASYSPYLQNVTTVFMFLFGMNFTCFYLLLLRKIKSVLFDEELRLYIGIAVASAAMIAVNIRGCYDTLEETIRHAAFQVSSIMTTTGYASTDFDLWPNFSKTILLFLMLIGACAGSTGGGFKCARIVLMFKGLHRSIQRMIHPGKVQVVRVNGKVVDEKVIENTRVFLAAYVVILGFSIFLVSIDGFSITTNLSAVASCFNNIGPGLDAVGPVRNFDCYSMFSKIVLTLDMLAGRLEIFPILILFSRSTWKNR